MKIYLVNVNDRHSDVYSIPFAYKEHAIKYAKEYSKACCRHEEAYHEQEDTQDVYAVTYSYEGDYISVTEAKLHQEEIKI